jgi:putative membrane protein
MLNERKDRLDGYLPLVLLVSLAGVFVWSAVKPYDYFTWVLEVAPAVIGVIVLLATYKRFRLTDLTYVLIWFFSIILITGGHYTYARMPLFDWLKETLDLTRNHYDRFGHFFQGVTPAMITREVLLRRSPLRKGKWCFFIVCCVALAISASYELFEWGMSIATGTAADDFVGSQGDVWDAQQDMFLCLCGAVVAQIVLGKWHDRQLEKISTMNNEQ